MGCEISKISKAKIVSNKKKSKKLLFLGVDNAGKTSILLQMKDHQFNQQTPVPTIGLNIETVTHEDYEFTLWDVGGSQKASKLWKHYFDSIDGVLFCIDISDKARLSQVKQALWKIKDPSLDRVPFLFYLNKSDKAPDIMTSEYVSQILNLEQLQKERQIRMQMCSALNGSGIWEGIGQIVQMIEQRQLEKEKENLEQTIIEPRDSQVKK